jgi:hypothetical protein
MWKPKMCSRRFDIEDAGRLHFEIVQWSEYFLDCRSSMICASVKPNSSSKACKAADIDSSRRMAHSTAKGSAFGSDVATKIASSTIPAAVLRNIDGSNSDIGA